MDFLKIFFVIHWSTFIRNLYLRNQKEKWNLDLRMNDCGMQVSIFCVCSTCASFAYNLCKFCVQPVQVLRTTKLSLLLFRSFVKETQSVSVHLRAQIFLFSKIIYEQNKV